MPGRIFYPETMPLDTVPIEEVQARIGKSVKEKRPAHISLFTGVGGFDLGFSKAGIRSAVMVEISPTCVKTLRHNWLAEYLIKRKGIKSKADFPDWYHEPEPVILEADITKTSTKKILKAGKLRVGETFVVSGGVPCQGFSIAGRRVMDDPRNVLFREFVRVVREALPVFFILENVPGLVTIGKGELIKQICEEFAKCGYNVFWRIVNCADYGVPQNRRRVMMIGCRIDLLHFPETGNPRMYLGAVPGKIDHPEKFRKKHKMPARGQLQLGSYTDEPKSLLELLEPE